MGKRENIRCDGRWDARSSESAIRGQICGSTICSPMKVAPCGAPLSVTLSAKIGGGVDDVSSGGSATVCTGGEAGALVTGATCLDVLVSARGSLTIDLITVHPEVARIVPMAMPVQNPAGAMDAATMPVFDVTGSISGFGEGAFTLTMTAVDGQVVTETLAWPSGGIGGAFITGQGNFR